MDKKWAVEVAENLIRQIRGDLDLDEDEIIIKVLEILNALDIDFTLG